MIFMIPCVVWRQDQASPAKRPPPFLIGLLTKDDAISKNFRDNIRPLNMMFSFTSLGRKIDNSINRGNGPKNFQTMGKTII